MDKFTLGIAQLAPVLGDLERNLALHEKILREAEGQGVDLLLFPELSLTGYFLKDMVPSVALTPRDSRLDFLKRASRGMAIVVGFVEESSDHRFFNAAAYFDDGKLRHVHRKLYLPTYGLFDEQRYFAQGDKLRAFDTRFGRMALTICEDLWHPATAYLAALDGAQVILCVSASPGRGLRPGGTFANAAAWEHLNRAYAQLFTCFLCFCNRVGYEDGACFWGGSEVIAPTGEALVRAPQLEEALLTVTIDRREVQRERIANPLLRDERLDLTIRELKRITRELERILRARAKGTR
ncbi:MAG: carbon-nitrogen hydrolase [candidate division NC10 bacterium]|nr:carbon-nitrogen hydrolase [candidate division NC10 bacterium]